MIKNSFGGFYDSKNFNNASIESSIITESFEIEDLDIAIVEKFPQTLVYQS